MAPLLLIAEENALVVYLLKKYARNSGFQAVFASDGERVLELAAEIKPDLIVLNIHLPGKTRGWDALAYLKASEPTCHIPIIVFQVDGDKIPDLVEELADGLVPMPLLYEDFQAALARVGIASPIEKKSAHEKHLERKKGAKDQPDSK